MAISKNAPGKAHGGPGKVLAALATAALVGLGVTPAAFAAQTGEGSVVDEEVSDTEVVEPAASPILAPLVLVGEGLITETHGPPSLLGPFSM